MQLVIAFLVATQVQVVPDLSTHGSTVEQSHQGDGSSYMWVVSCPGRQHHITQNRSMACSINAAVIVSACSTSCLRTAMFV
jgi:hypothetical protein